MSLKMKEVNGKWYSRTEFSTYETRVKLKFTLLDNDEIQLDIYTTETDRYEIRKAINDSLNREKCITFEVIHTSTKAQDDATTKFLEDFLADD
tara:strand:- start:109 stop:387 length:279 start_codon:yes stop_codon:yes gene_type:complete